MNAFIPALFALFSSLIPLVLPLARNLEYEYASLVAYLLLLMPLVDGFGKFKLPSLPSAFLQLLICSAFTLLPALILFKTQICLCSENDFRFWWFVQILPHLCFSLAVTWWMRKARGEGRKYLRLTYALVLLGLFLHLAWTLWSLPQKRITHVLSGFIHGAIYDNGIAVDDGILWARSTHLLLALGLMTWIFLPKIRAKALALVFVVASLYTSYRASQFPSTTHGLVTLNEQMPETKTSRYFTLHYKKPNSAERQALIEQIFASAEFHAEEIGSLFSGDSPHVQIYIYPSRRDKKLWFGGDGTDITDVKTPSVHIVAESWPHGTLRHELVHAMASSIAFHGLGFHPNMAFTEGLATALAPTEDELSLHAGAASVLRSQKIDPERLFSPLFWGESGRRAYTVAGSLIKYLIDHYGFTQVKALYAGKAWEDVFSRPSSALIEEWRDFLSKNYAEDKEDIASEALFRYPGILNDLCPHSKALLASSSKQDLVQIRQPKGWVVERDYWTWRLMLEPGPSTRLQLLKEDFFLQGASEELLERVERERNVPIRVQEDIEAAMLAFDMLVAMNRPQEAARHISDLLMELERYKISDSTLRQLWSRKVLGLMDNGSSRAWLKLLAGLMASVPKLEGEPRDNPWILNYLYLRNHRFAESEKSLIDVLALEPVPKEYPRSFAVEWWKILGTRYFELREYSKAAIAFENAAKEASEGAKDALLLQAREVSASRNKSSH